MHRERKTLLGEPRARRRSTFSSSMLPVEAIHCWLMRIVSVLKRYIDCVTVSCGPDSRVLLESTHCGLTRQAGGRGHWRNPLPNAKCCDNGSNYFDPQSINKVRCQLPHRVNSSLLQSLQRVSRTTLFFCLCG